MGIWSEIVIYAKSVGFHWFAIITGAIPMIADTSNRLVPKWKQWAEKCGFPEERRRPIEIVVFALIVLWAGFAAWDEEYKSRVATESALNVAKGQVVGLQAALNSRPAVAVIAPSANRARLKAQLQQLYVETNAVLQKIIAMPDAAQMREAKRQESTITSKTVSWLNKNMGPASVVKYNTAREYMYTEQWPGEHSIEAINVRMRIVDSLKSKAKNLEVLMGSDEWDDPDSGSR